MYNIGMNKFFIKLRLYTALVVMFSALFPSIGGVQAGQLNLDNIPELEAVDFFSVKEFEEKTKPIIYDSKDNKSLAYKVRLPQDWSKLESYGDVFKGNSVLGESVLGKSVLGNIAYYVAPSNSIEVRSFFTVDAMRLSYEISAQNWFINYTLTNGLSLEQMTTKNKRELEAVYVEVRKDTTYIVRARAIINGSDMIVSRYYVAQQAFEKEKVMQAQVIDSFELSFPDKRTIEELKTYGFLSQSYFDYPPSWRLKTQKIYSLNKMTAQINLDVMRGKLGGQIDIKLYNKLSTAERSDVVKKFREDFSIDKYKVGSFIESPEMEYHSGMSFGTTQSYELNPIVNNMIRYELWVSVMEGKDYHYLMYMVTPARKEDFNRWARNIETYKLVVKSMRRHDSSHKIFDFVQP